MATPSELRLQLSAAQTRPLAAPQHVALDTNSKPARSIVQDQLVSLLMRALVVSVTLSNALIGE
jgi:hypothetical protein